MTKRKNVFRLFAVLGLLFSLTLVACDDGGSGDKKDDGDKYDISLTLDTEKTTIEVGETLQLSYTVDPNDVSLTFQSSNEEVATVTVLSGKVTGVSLGTTTITATASKADYNTATATLDITVGEGSEPDTGGGNYDIAITLNASETVLEEGETTQLSWDVSPSDASVTFTSSSTSVATVDTAGKVTAVKAGSATITATASKSGYTSASDSVIITVSAKEKTVTIDSYYALYGDFSDSSWNASPTKGTSQYALGYSSTDASTKYWEVTVTTASPADYDPGFRIVEWGAYSSVVANNDNLSNKSTGVTGSTDSDNNVKLSYKNATYNLIIDMTSDNADDYSIIVSYVPDYSNCDSKYILVGDFIDADWTEAPENEDYYLPYLSTDSSTKTWERIVTIGAHPETDDWYTYNGWEAGFRIIDGANATNWTLVAGFEALDTTNSTGILTSTGKDDNIQLTSWSASYKLVIDLTAGTGSSGSIKVTLLDDEDSDSCYEGEALNLASDFAMGMDVSSIIEVEKAGGVFYDENGAQVDAITYLASKGVNYARIRLWNDPNNENGDSYEGGGNDVTRDIEIAKRCVTAGMKICLDFHYSDFWAHHGQQYCPKAWTSLSASERITTAASWTKEVLQQFKDAGCESSMVQVGNETNNNWICGFQGDSNAQNFFVQCTKAVREFDSNIQIVVHYADDQSASNYTSSWQSLINAGAEIDVLGLSYYPFWHESMSSFKTTLNSIASSFPNKKICLMEYSYAWTTAWKDVGKDNRMNNSFWTTQEAAGGYSASIYGQSKCIYDIHETLASVNNVIGSFYWEPAWLCVENGSSTTSWASSNSAGYYQDNGVNTSGYSFDKCTWANQAFFNYSGKAIDSINIYDTMLGTK